jgi:hypothetical protein
VERDACARPLAVAGRPGGVAVRWRPVRRGGAVEPHTSLSERIRAKSGGGPGPAPRARCGVEAIPLLAYYERCALFVPKI